MGGGYSHRREHITIDASETYTSIYESSILLLLEGDTRFRGARFKKYLIEGGKDLFHWLIRIIKSSIISVSMTNNHAPIHRDIIQRAIVSGVLAEKSIPYGVKESFVRFSQSVYAVHLNDLFEGENISP